MKIIATWKHVLPSCFLGRRRWRLSRRARAPALRVPLITGHSHLTRSSSSSRPRRHGDIIDVHMSARFLTMTPMSKWWTTKNSTLCLAYRLSLSLRPLCLYECFHFLFDWMDFFPELLQDWRRTQRGPWRVMEQFFYWVSAFPIAQSTVQEHWRCKKYYWKSFYHMLLMWDWSWNADAVQEWTCWWTPIRTQSLQCDSASRRKEYLLMQ